jgi:hypothetical protein
MCLTFSSGRAYLPAASSPAPSCIRSLLPALCCRSFKHRHTWLGFFDADEFLWLPPPSDGSSTAAALDVNRVLRDYEAYGGLGVNWRVFGSSGRLQRPEMPVAEAYTACFGDDHDNNNHVKVIANTKYIAGPPDWDPHSISLLNATAHPMVNADFERFSGPFTKKPSLRRIALYHYVTKSKEEFAQKIARSSPTCKPKTWQLFVTVDQQATDTNTEAVWISQACGMRDVVSRQKKWLEDVGFPRARMFTRLSSRGGELQLPGGGPAMAAAAAAGVVSSAPVAAAADLSLSQPAAAAAGIDKQAAAS